MLLPCLCTNISITVNTRAGNRSPMTRFVAILNLKPLKEPALTNVSKIQQALTQHLECDLVPDWLLPDGLGDLVGGLAGEGLAVLEAGGHEGHPRLRLVGVVRLEI